MYTHQFVNMASQIALDSDMRCKHGAVIVKNGRVISRACNLRVLSPSRERERKVHEEYL